MQIAATALCVLREQPESLTLSSLESRMIGKPSRPVRREAARKRTCHGRHLAARPTRPPGCTVSAAYGSAGNDATTSTRPFSDLPSA